MLLRIILEALAAIPSLTEEIASTVKEMHSADPTGTKASKAAEAASLIAATTAAVLKDAKPAE